MEFERDQINSDLHDSLKVQAKYSSTFLRLLIFLTLLFCWPSFFYSFFSGQVIQILQVSPSP